MMGLDAVEVVMSIEDHFGIRIKTNEAANVRSVGDLIDIIRGRIIAANKLPCPCLLRFHELRRLVRETTGDRELRIRPIDDLELALSPRERRQLWERLPAILGESPPELSRSRTVQSFLRMVSFTLLSRSVIFAIALNVVMLPLALATTGLIVLFLFMATANWKSVPPDGWKSFGDVTRRLVGSIAATKQLQLKTDESILQELRPIIAETIGVDPGSVIPAALLIEDLGMG